MIILASAIFGILLGLTTARRHKGNRKDMAQYAMVYGIIFTLIGLFASMAIERIVG